MSDEAVQADRELLLAAIRRHGDDLPAGVLCALSAAADELVDPLVLPAAVRVDPAVTEDLAGVLTAVRTRLQLQDPRDLSQAAAAPARPASCAALSWRWPRPTAGSRRTHAGRRSVRRAGR